jgi:gliding motility-associated-like protein
VRSWNWSFGDGYNDSIQNPTHTYTSSGSILVRLIDTTNLGCYDSLSRSITIHPIPITNPLRDTILCQNKYANFQSSGGVTYFWSPAADLDNPSSSNPTTTVLTNGIYTVTVADINKCQVFDTVLTTYNFLFPRFYTENKCLDSLVSFIDSSTTNTGIINVWNWNFGDGNTSTIQNPFHLYGSPGVFNVTMYIENSSGCDTSISTNIEIYSLPKLPYDNDTICLGDRYQIISDSNYRHLWTYNPTLSTLTTYNPIANTSTSTNYYVTLTDTHFCINKDTFNLQVNLKPSIRISLTDPYFCSGDTITLSAISTASKIVWNNGSSLSDSTIFNPIAYLNDTITYKVRVEDGAGCFNIDSTTLIVEQKVIAIAYMDTMICRGSALHLSADGGKYYDWTPTTYLQASTLQMVRSRPDSSIIYTVNVSNDCFSDDTFISIFVNQLPLANAGPDVSIYRNETANLLASGGISYSWFPDNSLSTPFSQSTIASPFYNTNYIVWVTDSIGCTAFDTVLVEVIANTVLLMPTAFSPDGNGINDVFRISKTLNMEQLISFEIYNRWGVKVFETSDINQGWDGNFKGREQPMSSFTWIIKAKDYDGLDILRSGIVTLLR